MVSVPVQCPYCQSTEVIKAGKLTGSPSKIAASLGCAARQWSDSQTTQPIFIIRCEPRFMRHCRKVYGLYHILKCSSSKNTTDCR